MENIASCALCTHNVTLRGKKRLFLAGVMVLALPGLVGPAYSETAGGIETVVVTAEKRAENLQDVPLSIVAATGEQLRDAQIDDISKLGKLAPSLAIYQSPQSAGVTLKVRGFGSPGGTGIDPDVAVYVDTAYIGRPGAIVSDFLDVKTVEVLRGPQGTLFGRNTAMGAISITTNAPSTDAATLNVMGQAGSYGTYKAQAIGNLPVTDTFAVRAAIGLDTTNGFWKNLYDGRNDDGRKDTLEGRLSAKWEIAPNLTWIGHLDGASTKGGGWYPLVVDGRTDSLNPGALTAFNNFIAANGLPTSCPSGMFGATPPRNCTVPVTGATPGGTLPVQNRALSYTVNQRADNPRLRDNQYGIDSDLSWNVSPDVMLRLVDTYRRWTDQQNDLDLLSTSLDIANRFSTFSSNSTSHELQLVTPKGAFLDHTLGFTAGLYYSHEIYRTQGVLGAGADYCSHIFSTIAAKLSGGNTSAAAYYNAMALCTSGPIGDDTIGSLTQFHQTNDDFAAYAQVNYAILPNLELNLGARQTWDWKDATFQGQLYNQALALITGNNCGPVVAPATSCTPVATDMSFNDSKPSWLASLSWHPTDAVMAFVTYSTGYKSGGFISGGQAQAGASSPLSTVFGAAGTTPYTAAQRTFASEFVKDIELGAKSSWFDGQFQLNVTLFNTQLEDFQDRSFNASCNCMITRNSGDVRARGFETEGQIAAIPHLNFNFSVDYNDAIYVTNTDAPQFDGCSAKTLSAAGTQCSTATQDLSGAWLYGAPKWRGTVGATYVTDPFLGGYTAELELDEMFTSSVQTTNTNNPQTISAGYGLFNGRLSFYMPDSNWQIDLFGQNLLNKRYVLVYSPQPLASLIPGVNNATTGASLYRPLLGDPRTMGVRISAKF